MRLCRSASCLRSGLGRRLSTHLSSNALNPTAGKGGGAPIPNVGKTLQLRAVLFELQLLLAPDAEHDPAQLARLTGGAGGAAAGRGSAAGGAAAPSLEQMRADAVASAGGGALDAVAALEKLRGGGGGGGGRGGGGDRASDVVEGDPSGAGGVRGKYMGLLRSKEARRKEKAIDPRLAAAADVFGKAGAAPDGDEYALGTGTLALLRYLEGRGVALGLALPDPAAAAGVTAGQLAAFEAQVGARFSFRLPHAGGAAEFPSGAALAALCGAQGLAPSNVMLCTSEGAAVAAARDAGCFSAFFHAKNARKPNTRPDFTIQSLLDLQGVTEELNGISWRGTA